MKNVKRLLSFVVVFIVVMMAFCSVSFAVDNQYTDNLIPTMTSYTSNGNASASSTASASFPAWKAFDHNTSDRNGWASNTTHPNWLAYEFQAPKVITKYTLCTNYVDTTGYQFPKNWTFEAWDGTQWVILDTRNNITNWVNNVKKEFYFTNVNTYNKYRVNVSSTIYGTSGSTVFISEMEMMESIVTAPTAPLNLYAIPGNDKVELKWNAVEGATSYNVKRSETPDGPYQTVTTITPGAVTYQDTGLSNGKTYYYVVSAVNAGGESPNSNEVSATPIEPEEPPVISGNSAILELTMTNGAIKEYDLTAAELQSFLTWYNGRSNGSDKAYYIFNKKNNIKPFLSRKEYISFDKISSFEVNEYAE
jgi:hypothetical protein